VSGWSEERCQPERGIVNEWMLWTTGTSPKVAGAPSPSIEPSYHQRRTSALSRCRASRTSRNPEWTCVPSRGSETRFRRRPSRRKGTAPKPVRDPAPLARYPPAALRMRKMAMTAAKMTRSVVRQPIPRQLKLPGVRWNRLTNSMGSPSVGGCDAPAMVRVQRTRRRPPDPTYRRFQTMRAICTRRRGDELLYLQPSRRDASRGQRPKAIATASIE
jgi:hypothetical protein